MQRQNGDWDCPKCKTMIFKSKRYCFKCNVDKSGNTGSTGKIGDWNCPRCNNYQFARNTLCRKCGCPKGAIIQDKDKKFDNKTKPTTTTKPTQITYQPRVGDWTCPSCNDTQYSFRTNCRRCTTLKPSLEKTKDITINDDDCCSICLDAKKNMLLLHASEKEGHLCCCETCANELIADNQPCPMCRQPVKQAIKVY
jgi:membrane protease subunit (stomatin/prohibitin family)